MNDDQQHRVDLVNALITRECADIIGLGSILAERLDHGGSLGDTPEAEAPRLYQVYHHHKYGGSLYLVWSDHTPTEDEVVEQVLVSDFEPELDEWIQIDSHEGDIKVLKAR